jgi:hypothetical protein
MCYRWLWLVFCQNIPVNIRRFKVIFLEFSQVQGTVGDTHIQRVPIGKEKIDMPTSYRPMSAFRRGKNCLKNHNLDIRAERIAKEQGYPLSVEINKIWKKCRCHVIAKYERVSIYTALDGFKHF